MEQAYVLTHGALKIPCKRSSPEDAPIRQIVIGVHGLGGSYDDPFQASLAEEMDLFCAAVVRFCLPCHGDSSMGEFTLRDCTDSLVTVATDAVTRYPQAKELCIFATGFGAYVTLAVMERLQALGMPMKVVLQTPSVRMDWTILKMCRTDAQTLWAMDQVALPTTPPLPITYSFFEELVENLVVSTYSVPMLILHCREDSYIRFTDVQALRNLNDRSKLVIFEGASHQFREEGAWDMVLDLTRDWFEFGQVLLCDYT